MKLCVFGLTLSSSWGNGHATLWRGLVRALGCLGHEVTFFERDVPYYAAHRDGREFPGARLLLYENWGEIADRAKRQVAGSDAVIVTSYCVDANAAACLAMDSAPEVLRVYYDLDTPVTLALVRAAESVPYLPPEGLGMFDLVLSYTGGAALDALRETLGARRVEPLYGHADPLTHCPVRSSRPLADLSYLGTYAHDRQPALQRLFIDPARRAPARRFVIGGSGYPEDFPWAPNISFVHHVAPADHPAFFCSSRLTLNITRAQMAAMGFCPSGRLFEAAACGVPLLSDYWEGVEQFFAPGEEILIARDTEEARAALDLSDHELKRIASAAHERVLREHTSMHRAVRLLNLLEDDYGHVGHHSGRGQRHTHSAARLLQGIAAGRGTR